jgi:NADH-quinone oxidoreductase subunit M
MSLVLGIVIPLLGAMMVAMGNAKRAKYFALAAMLLQVAWYCVLAFGQFDWSQSELLQFTSNDIEWFPSLGLKFALDADGISMLLIGLTALLGPLCVMASFTAITERVKTYYSWLLILQSAMTGVFMAQDMILFYVFFEFTLVPMYILINLYGSTNRKAAATKFFLYTFTGSLITLAGLVYIAWSFQQYGGRWTFEFQELSAFAREHLTRTQQAWVFWALLAGFAVKVPLFPVHTWLPLAHTEAPTAGSVVLAGVLLKLGTYGIYRFALGMVPMACVEFAPVLATLSVIGILYAGLICWVQRDVKKLVAYSSVSHLGYCVLGLFALNSIGMSGSILYMINHGLSTGALFLLIGFMYERYHTRSLDQVGGLASRMPIWSTFMVFFAMASVGLPGLNGFISEFMCMLGTFQAGGAKWSTWQTDKLYPGGTWGELGPVFAVLAGAGMIVTAMYLLFMLGKIVWGPLREPDGHGHGHGHGHDDHGGLPVDLTKREIGTLVPLAVLCLLFGLYPKPLLNALEKPVAQQQAMIHRARVQLATIKEAERTKAGTPATPSTPATGHADEHASAADMNEKGALEASR